MELRGRRRSLETVRHFLAQHHSMAGMGPIPLEAALQHQAGTAPLRSKPAPMLIPNRSSSRAIRLPSRCVFGTRSATANDPTETYNFTVTVLTSVYCCRPY